MTQPAKPRRHFIAWSPIRTRAFRATTANEVKNLVRDYELASCVWTEDCPPPTRPTWRHAVKERDWRVTEVSE